MIEILGPMGLRSLTRLDDGTFGSPVQRFAWSRVGIENAATCLIGEPHKAPKLECTCGLYIPKEWQQAIYHRSVADTEYTVYTLCVGLGTIQEAELVYRCQQTAIVGLVNMDETGQRLQGVRFNELLYAQRYFSTMDLPVYTLSQAIKLIEHQRGRYEYFCKTGVLEVSK